ncbi:MAG TPA: glycerol kinase GlpK [Burkholderiaceae bacterium]|jgi:glycerol kinase
MSFLLALDQGTSSSRAIVFDVHGRIVAMAQRELTQHYPQPGWVEHDPLEIWQTQLETAREALARAGLAAKDIAALGITNQRETIVVWDRRSGEPLHKALVWQDRRGEALCARMREEGHAPLIQRKTGLVIDAYFSASKLHWLLENIPNARQRAANGELAFGTIDSWLLWKLTQGTTQGAVHSTDQSNASRTMLYDIHENRWDDKLLQLFDVPHELLPEVHPSAYDFGETAAALFGAPIRIGGIAGDQQAALFGQACFSPGMAKNTYGTGCFMLMNTDQQSRLSANGLLTTLTAQPTRIPEYALEGSVFIGGAVVQWLRDSLGIIQSSAEVEALAASVPDAGGVMFVPAFTGLGAPYWNGEARGTISGLTRGSTRAHIARAAVESIAYQSAALLGAMSRDAQASGSAPLTELRVDGGACVNDALMQFQADLLGIAVVRPRVIETTALGAAQLAGLTSGLYHSREEIAAHWQAERRFEPQMARDEVAQRMENWERAVRRATS